jgi:hypothetical protein
MTNELATGSLGLYDQQLSASGTTGTRTATGLSSSISTGFLFAIQPNSTRLLIGNSTVNTIANSSMILISGQVNSTINTYTTHNTSVLFIGNSTVNTTLNSTFFTGTSNLALTANNATNLGTAPASAYVNTSGNFSLAGNISFTGSNVHIAGTNTDISSNVTMSGANVSLTGLLNIGANVSLSTSVLSIGNSTVNSVINSTFFTGQSNTTLIANNALYLGGTIAASYALINGTVNNSTNFNSQAASFYTTAGGTMQLIGTGAANGTYFLVGYAAKAFTIIGGYAYSVSPVGNVGTSCANVIIQNNGANVGGLTNVIANGTSNIFVTATSNTTVAVGSPIQVLVNNSILTGGSLIIGISIQ